MDYGLHLAVVVLIWIALGLSQGILTGYLGILAVNQAAAWGIGAYTAALLNIRYGLPIGATALPAAAAAGVFSMMTAWVVGNARREDQVIASLCIQIIVVEIFLNWQTITNGPLGIADIGWGGANDYESRAIAALVAAGILVALALGMMIYLRRTSLPGAWSLLRDDRKTAESFGLNVPKLRAVAFLTSALIAGVAGSIYAHYITFIDPSTFGLSQSVAILAVAVIGRAPSAFGICVSAAVLILLPEALRFEGIGGAYAANLRQALFGIFLVLSLFSRKRAIS